MYYDSTSLEKTDVLFLWKDTSVENLKDLKVAKLWLHTGLLMVRCVIPYFQAEITNAVAVTVCQQWARQRTARVRTWPKVKQEGRQKIKCCLNLSPNLLHTNQIGQLNVHK